MPCFCQYFPRGKQRLLLNERKSSTKTDSVSQRSTIQDCQISASQFAALKAEVWSLRHSLAESVAVAHNMQEVITHIATEKYEVLDDLYKERERNVELQKHLNDERQKALELRNELQSKLETGTAVITELTHQNVEAKQSLIEANETIQRMGLMFINLKNEKQPRP